MNSFQKRIRAIMERENLTYDQVANLANVSTQAVHKWLTSGLISDEKARAISQEIGIDWIWLKHGVSRVSDELLYDVVGSSTSNSVLMKVGTFEVLAVGEGLLAMTDYSRDEILGKSILEFLPNIEHSIESIRRGHKMLVMLGSSVEYSYRFTFRDKNADKAIEVRGKAITTDNEGNTYSLEEVREVPPDGTEDTYRSFKLSKRYSASLSEDELIRLHEKFPDYPWLKDFLRD